MSETLEKKPAKKVVKKNVAQEKVTGQLDTLLQEANIKPNITASEETPKLENTISEDAKLAYKRLYRKEQFMDFVLGQIYLDKSTKVKEEKPQTFRIYRGNVLKFGTLRASFEMGHDTVYVIEHNNKETGEAEMLYETVSVLQGYNISLRK